MKHFRYNNIKVAFPTYEENFNVYKLTPHECRVSDLTYAGNI